MIEKKEYTTLKKNSDFKRVYFKGKSYVSSSLVVYVFKNKWKLSRYGITTSKKIGCAVKRNRARRIIKQAFRELSKQVKPGYDLIFVARGKTPFLTSVILKKDLYKILKKNNLILD